MVEVKEVSLNKKRAEIQTLVRKSKTFKSSRGWIIQGDKFPLAIMLPFAVGTQSPIPVALIKDNEDGDVEFVSLLIAPEMLKYVGDSEKDVSLDWVIKTLLKKDEKISIIAVGDSIKKIYTPLTPSSSPILSGVYRFELGGKIIGSVGVNVVNDDHLFRFKLKEAVISIAKPWRCEGVAGWIKETEKGVQSYYLLIASLLTVPLIE